MKRKMFIKKIKMNYKMKMTAAERSKMMREDVTLMKRQTYLVT